jgi:hypothetical protein
LGIISELGQWALRMKQGNKNADVLMNFQIEATPTDGYAVGVASILTSCLILSRQIQFESHPEMFRPEPTRLKNPVRPASSGVEAREISRRGTKMLVF